uniref:Ig-like domain-containing protein n=1 Tax=Gouania willdenowi TaxID=441366 RepID=A0A8C5G1C0_GOUWI
MYCCSLTFSSPIGVSLSVKVDQTPVEAFRKPGDKVQLVCSHGEIDYRYMQWYQQSHREPGLKRIGHVNNNIKKYEEGFQKDFIFTGDLSGDKAKNITLTISNLKTSEHSAVYYCAASYPAYFGQGTRLTVLGREPIPPTVKLFKPSAKEGDRTNKKTLVCLASDFYPDHVSVIWSINGNRHEGSTDSAAQQDGSFYRITSRLTVNAEQWHNPDNSFKCEVNFFDGKTTITHQKTLKGVKGTKIFSVEMIL